MATCLFVSDLKTSQEENSQKTVFWSRLLGMHDFVLLCCCRICKTSCCPDKSYFRMWKPINHAMWCIRKGSWGISDFHAIAIVHCWLDIEKSTPLINGIILLRCLYCWFIKQKTGISGVWHYFAVMKFVSRTFDCILCQFLYLHIENTTVWKKKNDGWFESVCVCTNHIQAKFVYMFSLFCESLCTC